MGPPGSPRRLAVTGSCCRWSCRRDPQPQRPRLAGARQVRSGARRQLCIAALLSLRACTGALRVPKSASPRRAVRCAQGDEPPPELAAALVGKRVDALRSRHRVLRDRWQGRVPCCPVGVLGALLLDEDAAALCQLVVVDPIRAEGKGVRGESSCGLSRWRRVSRCVAAGRTFRRRPGPFSSSTRSAGGG